MNGDNQADFIFYALALVLPLSALISRRLPLRGVLTLAGVWIGIFVVGMLVVGLTRDGLGAAGSHILNLLSDDEQRVTGGTVRLRAARDGHYWATAEINGVRRRMLIDSGATTTSISLATARAANIDLDQSSFPVSIETANGMVLARTSSVHKLTLGPITADDLRVVVAREFGDTDVLGMNFLSRLASWRMENGFLVLQPRAALY